VSTPEPTPNETAAGEGAAPGHPVALPANQPPDRFYRGGERIAAFRGAGNPGPRTPEDWIASTTSVRGQHPFGLTTLPDGTLLADAVARDPLGWLGADHVARFGADTRLLVKLLDAGQRLPVHAHPNDSFAAEHLGTAHGKAEAWYILTPGTVHLGLTRSLEAAELRAMVDTQAIERMLALMHPVEVAAGDTVYVPPGVLHAIGEGILLAEVQQPEDLSILLEWRDFAVNGPEDGHLGLGFDEALEAVETRARTAAEIDALLVRAPSDGATLAHGSEEYFRLDRVHARVNAPVTLEPGFAVLIVTDGEAEIGAEIGRLTLPAGSTAVLPHASGPVELSGDATVLVARPPLP
jgi:mannose-6-phosphate isomerase